MQKNFEKKIFFHLAQAVQSFWKNHLVKWPFSVARWSENSKFDFFAFFQFVLWKLVLHEKTFFWDAFCWSNSKNKKLRVVPKASISAF